MTFNENSPRTQYRLLTAISSNMREILRRINAAPRWMLWLKATFLVGGLLVGVYYLMPHIQPLALSRELVVGTRQTPTSFMQEKTTDENGKAILLETGFDHDLVMAFAQSLGKKYASWWLITNRRYISCWSVAMCIWPQRG